MKIGGTTKNTRTCLHKLKIFKGREAFVNCLLTMGNRQLAINPVSHHLKNY